MKKLLILAGIAGSMAISSCTKELVTTENKGRPIDFSIVETKGKPVSENYDITDIFVTAFDENGAYWFENSHFGRNGDYLFSATDYYWPSNGSNLSFVAYAPQVNNAKTTAIITESNITGHQLTVTDFTPDENINNHIDFITSEAIGNDTDESVTLSFRHRLSRIAFTAFENNQYSYEIKAVKIANVYGKGTFTLSSSINTDENQNKYVTAGNSAWNLSDQPKTSYQLEMNKTVTLSNGITQYLTLKDVEEYVDSDNYNDAMIIPQTVTVWNPAETNNNGAYIAALIQIKSESGDQIYPETSGGFGWVAIPLPADNEGKFTFVEGNKYTFSLNFTNGAGYKEPEGGNVSNPVLGDGIKFVKVKVNPFDENSENEANMQKDLEGRWLAKKVEVTFTPNSNFSDGQYEHAPFIKETESELKEWYNNNGFYQFTVDHNYNIFTTTPSGATSKSSFYVKEEVDENQKTHMKIYLEAFKYGNSYQIVPEVYSLDRQNNTCIIYLLNENWYAGEDRHQYMHYELLSSN